MLEFDFHGGDLVTSLNYVVGYLKTYYEKKIGLGPFLRVPTLRFLGPIFRARPENRQNLVMLYTVGSRI